MKKIAISNFWIKEISNEARKLNLPVYLVGGSVRDFLLRKKSLDLDIVVEGNPSELVRKLSRKWKAKIASHNRFGTFVLTLNNGFHIDFATARKEKYVSAGQLPVVKASNLEEDIKRRDFAINAVAVSLNKSDYGRIIDLCNGLLDIKRKHLKVLHSESFKDDPTRILRLLRFASRGFKIPRETEMLVIKNKKYIPSLSDERISREIIEILSEKKPSKALKYLKKWNLFDLIFPFIDYNRIKNKIDGIKNLKDKFIFLMERMNELQKKMFLEKFKLSREFKKSIEKEVQNDYKPLLTGNDLISMGYTPGPQFRTIFETLR